MWLLDPIKRSTSTAILHELKKIYGQVIPVAQLRAKFFKCHQQEDETAAAYILRLRELFSTWREHEPAGSAQDETTVRDQLVLGLRPGLVQQELQRQVRRNPTMSFGAVSSELRALEAELKMEFACASRVSVPQPRQALATPCPEDWKETKWLSGEQKRSPQDLHWLTLKAANGLRIPYTGYAILDFTVGGVTVPGKGVIIVKDECLNAEEGILGMNVISHFWKELFQGVHPGLTVFGATMSQAAKGEWKRAFAVCQKVSQAESSDKQIGVARLTRQDPVYVPPNSEMVLWTQLYGPKSMSDFCALVEGPERDDEWQVARTVVQVVKGHLPIRVCNMNPYPVLILQRRPLANVFQVDPSQIRGEKDLVLKASDPGVVEVDVQASHITTEDPHPVSLLKGEGLTTEQQRKMDALLQRWKEVFAASDEDFGQTSAVLQFNPYRVCTTQQGAL
ncbi:hypothetical protein D5F01_LYC05635 [Larimichthys crocea]|uniref:Paraneoplastic antigen Ma-like C-terminal domain-containing protein n=1 Tax=Larimichthys crocea TaxID=215358 RepID=A0A6G0IZB6_LARCR|nr:hypothetical protein D5F01_LYC05635 [Larimichthys crocea]